MKHQYETIELEIYIFENTDVITMSGSGEVEGEETKYPIPGGWVQ